MSREPLVDFIGGFVIGFAVGVIVGAALVRA